MEHIRHTEEGGGQAADLYNKTDAPSESITLQTTCNGGNYAQHSANGAECLSDGTE